MTDLDEESKEAKDSDLLAAAGRHKGYVETKSSGNRNCREDDLEDFDDNIDAALARHGQETFKLIVFNGQIDARAEAKAPTFSSGVIREAQKRGMALTTGLDLLVAIEAVRSGGIAAEDVRTKLQTPGLVEIKDS